MFYLGTGNTAEWIGNIISLISITATFFTVRNVRKNNRKAWEIYKQIEFKRNYSATDVEIVSANRILVIRCQDNEKVPVFLVVNKLVRRKNFDMDRLKTIKIEPAEYIEIYKVDLKYVLKFYEENKSKLKRCEDLCFYIEELEGKRKYLKIDDIFEE